jgi:hypothetical protein
VRHRPDRRDEDGVFRRWGRIDPVLGPLADCVAKVVLDVLGRRIRVLQPRARKVPVNVGVSARDGVPAMLAGATRPRLRASAEQPLSEPQRKPLLADAHRPLQQERGGERIAPDRVVEATADRVMAMEWEQRHGGKVRRADRFRRVVPSTRDGHGS